MSISGVTGVCGRLFIGTGGAWGIIDSLFNLRASVGLIVLAPSPVAWWGIADALLFAEEDGVPVRPPDRPGVLDGLVEDDLVGSGVLEGTKSSLLASLLAGWRDFAFKLLELVDSCRLPCRADGPFESFSAVAFRAPMLGLLRGGGATFSEASGATNVPGPIDLRGARGAGLLLLLKALGGN